MNWNRQQRSQCEPENHTNSRSIPSWNALRHAIEYVERPLIYSITVLVALVSLLVYGMTLLRGGDGLLDFLRPVFGVPFWLLTGATLIFALAITGRWKSLVVVGLGEAIHILTIVSPTRERPFDIAEHLSVSVTIAFLLVTTCMYYHLVDEDE